MAGRETENKTPVAEILAYKQLFVAVVTGRE